MIHLKSQKVLELLKVQKNLIVNETACGYV